MSEKSRILGAAGGAVGMTGIAAFLGTCCVAPWAVTLFGVSGAVMLARASVAQPWLILTATMALGLAFWWAYRRAPVVDGQVCDVAANRRMRRWLWVAAVLMAILAVASVAPQFVTMTGRG